MNPQETYADVLLPLALKGSFTYRLPGRLIEKACPGMRAIVQFGARKLYTALILNIHRHPPGTGKAKEIIDLPDKKPLVSENQIKFWNWMARYYLCNEGEVFRAALPAGLRPGSETKISLSTREAPHGMQGNAEKQILQVLQSGETTDIKELIKVSGLKNPMPAVHALFEKRLIQVAEKIQSGYRPRQEISYSLAPEYSSEEALGALLDRLQKAPEQRKALENFLFLAGEVIPGLPVARLRKSVLLKGHIVEATALESLVKKGILQKTKTEISRLERTAVTRMKLPVLTSAQKKALKEVKSAFEQKDTLLLYGVTSSGKTEIYAHLMRELIEQGKQVLFLLPEIALTSQIIDRLEKYFGNRVGVYHSKYSDAERVEIWNNLNSDDPEKRYSIILGARSAVFLPFRNLGLIIVDEENEPSYKQQDPAPRYHGRDAAIYLARISKAKTLLGTATPSLESFYNTKTGKFGLIHLAERFGPLKMPGFVLANSREAYRKRKMTAHFTPELLQAVTEALEEQEQVILFQNRRGYSPYVQCLRCGWIPQCKHCDVNLTYHKFTHNLTCHYCGYSETLPGICPECGASELKTKGFGTEQIEEETSLVFPHARITRLDLDTGRSKRSYQKILRDFQDHKSDILIGTQMISRGLDFEHVRLVGVLNADNLMFFPDFRAYERAFQLLTQVGGRAGRRDKRGKVIIQTSEPDHPVLQWVTTGDYTAMYQDQIEEREHFKYPPHYRMIKLLLKGHKRDILNREAARFGRELKKTFGSRVLGPQEPLIGRVKLWYLKQIILKLEREIDLPAAKNKMMDIIADLQNRKEGRSIRVVVDVDPV